MRFSIKKYEYFNALASPFACCAVYLLLLLSVGLGSIKYDNSWAVVIGVNEYQNENITDLSYAVSDANGVKEMLIEYYGFSEGNITMLLDSDATALNIKKAISGLSRKTKSGDRIIIFYAGHGMTEDLPGGGEMGYLVPHDGDLEDLYLTSIPMKELRNLSDRFDAKHVLFLVDACYGGLAAVATRGLSNKIAGYYDKIFRGKARQIITAGGKGETVIEKADWGHSAFTYNLLRGLRDWMADLDNDGYITGEELGIYLKKNVTQDSEAHQTPTVGRFSTDQGEFMFTRPDHLGGINAFDNVASSSDSQALILEMEKKNQELQKKLSLVPTKSVSTAKSLSFLYPGMGHLYLGRQGKGLMWMGLGTASLAGVFLTYSSYSAKSDEFDKASLTYAEYSGSSSGFSGLYNKMVEASDAKKSAQTQFIVASSIYAGVVLFNYLSLGSIKDDSFSSSSKVVGGVDSKGQVFIQYNF